MHLYKYRDFSLNHIQAVTNNELWFSLGSTFNDPFDSQPPMYLFSTETLFKFVRSNPKHDLYNDDSIKAWAENWTKRYKNSDLRSNSLDTIEKLIVNWTASSFIHCFSQTNENILMWSHYANYHKGFCVRYDLDKLLPSLNLLAQGPVRCKDEIKDLFGMLDLGALKNLGDDAVTQKAKEIVISILTQKAEDWGYEEEYRLILNERSSSPNLLSKCIVHSADAIDGMFFGVKSTERDRAFLKGALSGRDIEFHVMKKHELDFKLVPTPYVT